MFTSEENALFANAIRLRDRGDFSGARDVFLELARRKPEDGSLRWLLGHLNWRLGRMDMAIDCFKEATFLAPRAERASRGLFHCLWEQGRRKEAFAEIKRFLAISDSEDYRKIIKGK